MKAIARKAQSKASAPSPAAALLALITGSLEDDKAEQIAVIDMTGKSAIADFMVIATGRSNRQVAAMAEHLREKLKSASGRTPPVEGLVHGDWVLVDGGDVVVHLFRPEVRAFYNLEKMWSEALPEQGDGMAGLIKTRPDKAKKTGKAKPAKAKAAKPKAAKPKAAKTAKPGGKTGAKPATRRQPARAAASRRRAAS